MINIETTHLLSQQVQVIHHQLLQKSTTYQAICDKIKKEGGATVKILDKKPGANASWLGGHIREIRIKANTDRVQLTRCFLFEMINASNESEFQEIDQKAKEGVYKIGKYGIPALNYSAASEHIEYDGMKLSNKIVEEMQQDNQDNILWQKNMIWYIPDFDDYFLTQIIHGHSSGTLQHYNNNY